MWKSSVFAAAALAVTIGVSDARADATLSTSNEPQPSLSEYLAALFGQGREEMRDLDGEAVDELSGTIEVEYSQAWLAERPAPEVTEPVACLGEALYFEARGETVRGQFAVAEVIVNRAASPDYPDTVCGVINQGVGTGSCQFSYNCDGAAEVIGDAAVHERMLKIAEAILSGAPRQLTEGATHYHADSVSPAWSSSFPRTAVIGTHLFYRQR